MIHVDTKQLVCFNAAALATKVPTACTYLLMDDTSAGQENSNDLVINITGYKGTLPALGAIPVGAVFL